MKVQSENNYLNLIPESDDECDKLQALLNKKPLMFLPMLGASTKKLKGIRIEKEPIKFSRLSQAEMLLKQWLKKAPRDFKGGAWDYDKEGDQLVTDTGNFLGMKFPWNFIEGVNEDGKSI